MVKMMTCPLCLCKVDCVRQHVYLTRGNYLTKHVFNNHFANTLDEDLCPQSGAEIKDSSFER